MVPTSSEPEFEVTGGDALFDTTAEDVQINKLGSTSNDLEGQVEGRNPATTQKSKTKKKKSKFDVLGNKEQQFQAILQLLQLVVSLAANSRNQKPEDEHRNEKLSSETRKAFDYVDAITNLMVRNGEVVAAVACGGQLENPSGGIFSFNLPSETLSGENVQSQPAPMDMDTGLSPDFYEDLPGSYLRVATVANSKFYFPRDFESTSTSQFTLLSSSDPETSTLWSELKQREPEDLVLWACNSKISLKGHMKILESYFNEYKQSNMAAGERSSISDKISKYIIGSCFKKMYRRAFHWASSFMIGSLTFVTWNLVATFSSIAIKPDRRLSTFLRTTTGDRPGSNKQTFGQWVMTYHPSKSLDELPSLDDFLTATSGASDYQFDQNIAAVFHNLLVSSLYAYLCLMKRLNRFIAKADEENIRRYVGPFSNAIRIFYLVSHSNAMKAYFTYVGLPLTYPMYQGSSYHKNQVDGAIIAIYTRMGWGQDDIELGANDGGDGEDPNPQENYVEDFKENDARSIYRRSFMSFVDHHAGLRLLERRSFYLPADEMIKLSLIAVKQPPGLRYFPWEEMERVIHKTCQDFRSTTSNPVEGQDVISEIKKHLRRIEKPDNGAIIPFKTLLAIHDNNKQIADEQYPPFNACIHCESSLAAILYQLHIQKGSDLHKLFQITDIEGMCYKYHISVSKFCCPVCWELLKALNETSDKVRFVVRAHHSNLYPVCLPPWLPDAVLEKMIQRFGEKLYEKFFQLPSADELPPFVPGHNKNLSLESAGESVSSSGSTDIDTARADHQRGMLAESPTRSSSQQLG